jgi:hypothetical protein
VIGRFNKAAPGSSELPYAPLVFYFAAEEPAGVLGFKTPGSGWMMPLILASARGRIVVFEENSTGWPCSAFYLGYDVLAN